MKKILLIEDNDDIRENTAEILELANYTVLTAANGKEGVEMALEHLPDLIVCDIMMPVLDGYGVLHALHRNETVKNTPFIFLTAKTERNDLRKGMEMGADDYITKPFDGTELLNAVDGRLKKVELLKKEYQGTQAGLDALGGMGGSQKALAALTDGRNINHYKKKQPIYTEGNHPSRLMYIVSGKVKAYKRNDDGKELVVELYNAGDFLGYIALLEGTTYKETAEAMDNCEIAVIPKEDFEELLHSNWEVAQAFIKLLAKNVADKENQLLGMAYNSLRKKVAEALVALRDKYAPGNDKPFSIDISRDNLASVAGTATESLIRTLSDFKSEKLIDIHDGAIVLLNPQKLKDLLN
jgi:CRP/FNR family transcriptional regulator, cyclic AMP receptor protein